MKYEWSREVAARWDADKVRIIGGQPEGVFDFGSPGRGEGLPGEWWRVSADSHAVGFAWMDRTWDGAEILLAVDPAHQHAGIGTFILGNLEKEAAARGLNRLYNVVRETHPKRAEVTKWLVERGFSATDDGELRRPVKVKVK